MSCRGRGLKEVEEQNRSVEKKTPLLTSSSSSVRHCLCPPRGSGGSRGISEGRIRLFGVEVDDDDEAVRRFSLLLLLPLLFFPFLSPLPAATAATAADGSSGVVLVKMERL